MRNYANNLKKYRSYFEESFIHYLKTGVQELFKKSVRNNLLLIFFSVSQNSFIQHSGRYAPKGIFWYWLLVIRETENWYLSSLSICIKSQHFKQISDETNIHVLFYLSCYLNIRGFKHCSRGTSVHLVFSPPFLISISQNGRDPKILCLGLGYASPT